MLTCVSSYYPPRSVLLASQAITRDINTDTLNRIPNPTTDCSIRIFPLLFPRSWSLYVPPTPCTAKLHTNTKLPVYIFAGSVLLNQGTTNNIFGGIIALVGVAYVVLEFIPSIEPPANMREADGGWGAEQV